MALLLFCAWVGGLEGEAVVNDILNGCQSRGTALPAGKEVLLPLPKKFSLFGARIFYPLRKQWHIISPLGLHIITPSGRVSHQPQAAYSFAIMIPTPTP